MIEAGKPRFLKERNQNMIEALILREGPITKPELSDMTQLSLPTVNKVVSQLEEKGIVKASGMQCETKAGRRAIYYEGNGSAVNVITVFYMDGKWIADIFNYLEKSIVRKTVEVDLESREATLSQFYDLVDALAGQAENLKAIGVGIPGVITRRGEITACSSIPTWIGLRLIEEMENRYDCKIIVENDVNLMTLGYYKLNVKKASDLVFLYLGRGVGGGTVINHKLHRGFSNFAGDFGYMVLACGGDHEIGEIEKELKKMHVQIGEHPDDKKMREQYYLIISRIIINCIVSINPEEIVLYGAALEKKEAEGYMKAEVEKWLPESCLPKISVTEYDEHGIEGLTRMCIAAVSNKYWLEEQQEE